MSNKLPKSWAVLNDGTDEFRQVIDYLNKRKADFDGKEVSRFYGINKLGIPKCGDEEYFYIILTLEQFIELSKEVEEKSIKEQLAIIRDNLKYSIPIARDFSSEDWRELIDEHLDELDDLIYSL